MASDLPSGDPDRSTRHASPCPPLLRVEARLEPLKESVESMEQRVLESALQVNRDLTVLTTNVTGLSEMVRGVVGKMDHIAQELGGLATQMARTNEQVSSSRQNYDRLDEAVGVLRDSVQRQSVDIARLQGADSSLDRVDAERIRTAGRNQYWLLPFVGFALSIASAVLLHFVLR